MPVMTSLPLYVAGCLFAAAAAGEPVSWWRFDDGQAGTTATGAGSVIDETGLSHGTPFNGPVYSQPIDNCASGGMTFDGINDRINIPDRPEYAILSDLTLEVILSISGNDLSPVVPNYLVFRGDDRNATDPFAIQLLVDNRLSFSVYNSPVLLSPVRIPIDRPFHAAVTVDGQLGAMHMYVDGQLVDHAITTLGIGGVLTGPDPGIGIGNIQAGWLNRYLAGTIYEVRISSDVLELGEMLCMPTCGPADIALPYGTLDLFDLVAFIEAFQDLEPVADMNADYFFDLGDISAYVAFFLDGCQ